MELSLNPIRAIRSVWTGNSANKVNARLNRKGLVVKMANTTGTAGVSFDTAPGSVTTCAIQLNPGETWEMHAPCYVGDLHIIGSDVLTQVAVFELI
jgi:molybdopterin-binding protein